MSGILTRLGAATSRPSRSYAHAWYMHLKVRLTAPDDVAHNWAPRCRQTLRKARAAPDDERVIRMLSRPTWTVRNWPGEPMSDERTAQNHICSRTRSCSA